MLGVSGVDVACPVRGLRGGGSLVMLGVSGMEVA